MCGICGFLAPPAGKDGGTPAALERTVRAMAGTLAHRGPDGEGAWVDAAAGVGLGHRRLAIVDLSPAGDQPMHSANGRWTVVFNGEIYNFRELRHELEAEGHVFRGHSDTEVLVEACARDGIAAVLPRLNGIFALAAWDRRERVLHLARDPLGVKPLYWARAGEVWLFASQPKALRAHPAFAAAGLGGIDPAALAAYLRLGCVPAPLSIHQGVRMLEPGTRLTLRAGAASGDPEGTVFWSLDAVARAGRADPLDLPDEAAADALEALLTDAVGRQMVADVPLGAFLSGGIDSSTVVALMQAQSARPVRSFTIGFREAGFDEADHARAVAAHLGTDHTELVVEPGHALDLVPRLAEWYDEPFADSSQIPTLLVSALTRRHVTVALSGDGGDELFGGYNRHLWAPRLDRRLAPLPPEVRRAAAAALRAVPPAGWDRLAALVPAAVRPRQTGDKLHKLAGVLEARDPAALYRRLTERWSGAGVPVRGGGTAPPVWGRRPVPDGLGPLERLLYLDSTGYLPDDILAKVDRASMAVGLEARVPLLDPRVVALAWRLPAAQKTRGGTGKWLLRRVLHRHVPPALVERPKSGFAVPLDSWLRGPLRDWAEALLDPHRLADDGLLDPGPVRALWTEHRDGRRNHREELWAVLMFQAWRERWADGDKTPSAGDGRIWSLVAPPASAAAP